MSFRLYILAGIALVVVVYSFLLSGGEEKTSDKSRPLKIVAFGDSLTYGYTLGTSSAYPNFLQQMLRDKGYIATLINAGLNGDTTDDAKRRLEQVLSYNPDIIILALGGNDMRKLRPAESIRADLSAIIDKLKTANKAILLAGIHAPIIMGPSYANTFNSIYETLAKQHKIELMPNILEDVAGKPELNLADGIHPNVQGAKIIAQNMLPHLLDVIDDL